MPDPNWEYRELKKADYEKALREYLLRYVRPEMEAETKKAGFLSPNRWRNVDKFLEDIFNEAMSRYDVEGFNADLPYVPQIMQLRGEGLGLSKEAQENIEWQYKQRKQEWDETVTRARFAQENWQNQVSQQQDLASQERWQYEQILGSQDRAYNRWLEETKLRENAKERAYNQQTRGLSGFLGGSEDVQGRDAQIQANQMFEEWRSRFGATLTQPEDWLKKWNVQNMANPFPKPEYNPIEEAQIRSKDAQRFKEESKRLESEWMGLLKSGQFGDEELDAKMAFDKAQAIRERQRFIEEQVPKLEMEKKLIERSPEYKEALDAATPHFEGADASLGRPSVVGVPSEAQRQRGAPAPAWLSKFVPEYPAGSEIIEKKQVAPGSLQTLSMARPSEIAGLQGYLEWAGQVPEDWMSETMLRQTRTPNIAGRWSPASQRA